MSESDLWELLQDHAERYPDMEAQDLYLLLHQRTIPPPPLPDEGFLPLHKLAQALGVEPQPWEEPVELLCPQRQVARVYLRPFLRAGGDLRRYFAAAQAAAAIDAASPLSAELGLAGSLLRQWEDGPVSAHDFAAYIARMNREGFPLVPHSPAYVEAYAPVYHVLSLDALAAPPR